MKAARLKTKVGKTIFLRETKKSQSEEEEENCSSRTSSPEKNPKKHCFQTESVQVQILFHSVRFTKLQGNWVIWLPLI